MKIKNYAYRMDHDTGFAPKTYYGLCLLAGCKRSSIEQWAKKGSWVVGIGGNGTGKPNKIIYAMLVDENMAYKKFVKKYPKIYKYLAGKHIKRVLVSKKYYYLGHNAMSVPRNLSNIIVVTQGCKCISNDEVRLVIAHIEKKYGCGKSGKPNNLLVQSSEFKCYCSHRM